MEIKIIETNKIESLDIYDPKTGENWIYDLMGNEGALPKKQDWETDAYLMTQDDFDWWSKLVSEYQKADERYHELENTIDDDNREALHDALYYIGGDLEDFPTALNEICEEFEN